ncbi:MAG TPA: helix-turn-helix domain-containing protein, partial [Ottowia sp.]|nr:helix-turn-helix domain-containing protein [Ottowia sp.]
AAPLDGNVRELENLLHRAVALGEAGASGFGGLEPVSPSAPEAPVSIAIESSAPTARDASASAEPAALPSDLESWLDAREREVLVRALDETGFNRTAAAARLGLNLRQMRYRMARLGITAPSDDEPGSDGGK